MMMKCCVLLVMGVAASAATAEPLFELVGPERTATIVLAKDAEESSQLAATEITNYVMRLTGKTMAVVREGSVPVPATRDASGTVLIGTLAKFPGEVPAEAKAELAKTEKTEAYWIGNDGKTMWIVGKEEVAELYGAYQFLEAKLGIRWFQAATEDDPGDYVPPHRDTIAFRPFAKLREPSFTERNLDMCSAATQFPAPHAQELYLRNGYRIHTARRWWPKEKVTDFPQIAEYYGPRVPRRRANLGGGHLIFASVWPPDEKHFKEHPEYFALVNGKRVMDKQYCYSNTDLLDLAADGAIRLLDDYGGLGQYCFALWDSASGACQCDKCVAMATAEETQRGIESTRFHTFVNHIAERIWRKWPRADLLYLAYWTYRQPPVNVPHDPRMPVQVCVHERCYGHDIDDPSCARNAKRYAELKEWTGIAPYVFTYEYFSATPSTYCAGDLSFAHDLKAYHALGLKGWKEEAIFCDSRLVGNEESVRKGRDRMPSTWQRMWIAGKLSWDIDLDERKLLAECESKYYGAAYPAMKKYQDLRRKLWDANRNCLGYPTGDQRTATLLNTAGAKEELLGYLDEADRLAGDDRILRGRIALDRRWLTEYWIEPNEKLRASLGKAMQAPTVAKGAIAVDGEGRDDAWVGAAYADDFCRAVSFANAKPTPIPAALATSVGVCQDGESLYFLVTAKEPNPQAMRIKGTKDVNVFGDDSVELFLYPPAMDNRYYHIAVNPKGAVYDAKCPGNEAAWDLGVTAKGRIFPDRYVLEIKVPAKNMHPLKNGETWTFNVARNRTIRDELTPKGGNWSIGGAGYHDTLAYRSLTIGGANLIRNGSFEESNEQGALKYWALAYNRAKVVEEGGNKVAELNGDVVYQYLIGKLAQPKEPIRIKYSFRAKGTGKLKTFFYSFTDTPNARAKHGYDRRFNPNHPGDEFELTPGWKSHSAEFTIPPGETCGLAFAAGKGGADIRIDDVAVTVGANLLKAAHN